MLFRLQVVTAALRLANAVAAGDTVSLQALALSGLVPVVGRFAERSYDYTLREQASIFLQHICYTSAACMQLLVACQVRYAGSCRLSLHHAPLRGLPLKRSAHRHCKQHHW